MLMKIFTADSKYIARFSALCAVVLGAMLQMGCATPSKDASLQSQAYDLYSKTATAYSSHGPESYVERKPYYREAYPAIDSMELRARVGTSAPFDSTRELSTAQASFITPIQDLRTALTSTEKLDRKGTLANPDVRDYQKRALDQIFYSIIHRQTVGAE